MQTLTETIIRLLERQLDRDILRERADIQDKNRSQRNETKQIKKLNSTASQTKQKML